MTTFWVVLDVLLGLVLLAVAIGMLVLIDNMKDVILVGLAAAATLLGAFLVWWR